MTTNQFPRKIKIREVGPREGFQSLSQIVSTDNKCELISALVSASVKEIEVTSFVRPDKVPQLSDAEELAKRLPPNQGGRYTALYLNQRGFERAEATGAFQNDGWFYTSPSATFLQHNNNARIEDLLSELPGWVSLFRSRQKSSMCLMVSNAFGCAYEGEIAPKAVLGIVERYVSVLASLGASLNEVCLADTVGMAHPKSLERCISSVRSLGIPVSLHLHDTRGLGITNSYVALQLGITTFETSIGGIGGCPFTPGAAGNVATEDMVYLCNTLGIETGLVWQEVAKAARVAERIIGKPLPGRVYKTI
jgi:hydroxymethylglutaryl-CoA lyase